MTRRARGAVPAGALALAAALALGAAAPAAALEVPFLSGRVVDEAEILSPGTEEGLTSILEQLERETGAQVVVLTVPSLEGEALEEYSLRVAETWKLGGSERDDGVLLLIARDDRQMRLEVGYGLEGAIPDVLAGRILDQAVRPRFRDGDFDAGVAAGVGKVAALVRGEKPEAVLPEPPGGMPLGSFLMMGLWIFLVFVLPALVRGKKRRFRVFGMPVVLGGFSGGSSRRGGWSGGGGGGGFSGGGGSFGGGGASSSW